MRLIQILVGALAISVGSFGNVGPIPGTQPVMPIFEGSDLVCNCVVESLRIADERTRDRGGKPFVWRSVVATVRVRDSYNKDMPANSRVHVAFEDERPITRAIPTLSEAETAIMFLRFSALSSAYEFADEFLGLTPFTSLPVQGDAPGPAKLRSALASVLHTGSIQDQINAMRLLEGFDKFDSGTVAGLLQLTSSADPEIALSSLAVLLKARAPGTVQRLEDYLRVYTLERVPVALLSVGAELYAMNDAMDLAPLEALTSSEHLSVKLGAIAAIRNIRSPHSANALADRLDDPNRDVRYLATITLSEIFRKGGDYAPSMYLFDKNPDFYTRLWKSWWAEEKQASPK